MKVYLGADHRGYSLKEKIKVWLVEWGYGVEDVGAHRFDPADDYVDIAEKVAMQVAKDTTSRGILLCGSGHGVDMTANRFPGVRAILGFNRNVVAQGREHEDANVLCLPAEWITPEEAEEMVRLFLTTRFSGKERYVKRLVKLQQITARPLK
jgi:ribose 5-phosphate isomerase B